MKRFALTLLLVGLGLPSAYGVDVILVDEDFESYADETALRANWDSNPAGGANFGLVDETIYPDAYPDGPGKGVEHDGGAVAEWLGLNAGNAIAPSETQNIVLRADLFDDGLGNTANKRMTVGLRGLASSGTKLLELGFYNSDACDPTICDNPSAIARNEVVDPMNNPGYYQGTTYGYRMVLFDGFEAPLLAEPDWQYFQLPQELDRSPAGNPFGDYNEDDITDAADYTVWRDSLGQQIALPNEDPNASPGMVDEEDYNAWADNFGLTGPPPNGIINSFDVGPGWFRYEATISPDSITVTIDLYRDGLRNTEMEPGVGEDGVDASVTWPIFSNGTFDSLRIGGPSNVGSMGGPIVFDNVYLALEDIPLENGALAGTGVPEPASALLMILGAVAAAMYRRR